MCLLNNHGGRTIPMIRYRYQFWRYFTSLFLHVSNQHIFGNLLLLYFLLKILKHKSQLKPSRSLFITLLAGLLSNILAGIPNQEQLGVGFSPVIYAALGQIIYEGLYVSQKGLKILFNTQELLIVTITVIFGLMSNGESSDVSSHLFGILFGYMFRMYCEPQNRVLLNRHSVNRFKAIVSISVIALNFVWLFLIYGSEEEKIAASYKMGCNYVYK